MWSVAGGYGSQLPPTMRNNPTPGGHHRSLDYKSTVLAFVREPRWVRWSPRPERKRRSVPLFCHFLRLSSSSFCLPSPLFALLLLISSFPIYFSLWPSPLPFFYFFPPFLHSFPADMGSRRGGDGRGLTGYSYSPKAELNALG